MCRGRGAKLGQGFPEGPEVLAQAQICPQKFRPRLPSKPEAKEKVICLP